MITKRICDLEKGDKFIISGREYLVINVSAVEVCVRYLHFDNADKKYFGKKSQQIVEMIKD